MTTVDENQVIKLDGETLNTLAPVLGLACQEPYKAFTSKKLAGDNVFNMVQEQDEVTRCTVKVIHMVKSQLGDQYEDLKTCLASNPGQTVNCQGIVRDLKKGVLKLKMNA